MLNKGNQPEQNGARDSDRDEHQGHCLVRSISPPGSASCSRHRRSARAIFPLSVSWSRPSRCSRPCSIRTPISDSTEWPNSAACSRARSAEMAISPRGVEAAGLSPERAEVRRPWGTRARRSDSHAQEIAVQASQPRSSVSRQVNRRPVATSSRRRRAKAATADREKPFPARSKRSNLSLSVSITIGS